MTARSRFVPQTPKLDNRPHHQLGVQGAFLGDPTSDDAFESVWVCLAYGLASGL